jgi:hypothetical protein
MFNTMARAHDLYQNKLHGVRNTPQMIQPRRTPPAAPNTTSQRLLKEDTLPDMPQSYRPCLFEGRVSPEKTHPGGVFSLVNTFESQQG